MHAIFAETRNNTGTTVGVEDSYDNAGPQNMPAILANAGPQNEPAILAINSNDMNPQSVDLVYDDTTEDISEDVIEDVTQD